MQPADRLHALDAVRAYALLLGVVLHAAAAFLEGFPIPMWLDQPSRGAAVIYYTIHMFRMSAFFLIAGFFARVLVERRGVKAFVKDRAKRVAVPLFLFGPVVMVDDPGRPRARRTAARRRFLAVASPGATAAAAAAPAPQTRRHWAASTSAHLWFLYYLLIFYALDARDSLARARGRSARCARGRLRSRRRVRHARRLGAGADRVAGRRCTSGNCRAGPSGSACRRRSPSSPNTMALIGYGMAFWLGWLLNRQVQALLDLQKMWWSISSSPSPSRSSASRRSARRRVGRGRLSPARTDSVHGCVCRRSLVLGVCIRRRRRAVLVESEPRDALSRGCIVLGLPDAHGDGVVVHHAAAAFRLALEHQARDHPSAARCRFCS